ncbi:MAG: nickel pincer cofactor biosynthesis protein LarC, partial [Polyangiales bacterium]
DMLVAGLCDLGVPQDVLEAALRSLPISGYELRFVARTRSSILARGLDVVVQGEQPSRDYAEISGLLRAATTLTEGARTLAERAFRLLAEAEAAVHGSGVAEVHFHEVGAVDSIVDIVAAAVALDYLGAEVVCSPLPMGRGFVRSQHGILPSPAPATLLLLQGVPTADAGIDAELVTPTGACLVRAAAKSFTRWPNLRPLRVGWGAGTRELPDRPNLLRVVLGDPIGAASHDTLATTHVVLELNVDDMTGELAAVALARAEQAGALDAWSTPIGMKKGRPALMLSALARRAEADAVARALLSETTSLGIRVREVSRIERARRIVEVQTPYGPIAVKVADGDGLPPNIAPEYEACRRAAEAHGVPVKQAYAAAMTAYFASAEQSD